MSNTELLTTSAVAERFEVDVRTVARWVKAGRLSPFFKSPGRRGAYLFTREEVERFAAEMDGAA